MRAAKAKSKTLNEFQWSNLTTNAFIGGIQKSWMTGQSTGSSRDTSSSKVSTSKASDQAPNLRRIDSAPEAPKAVNNIDPAAFEADSDGGRYPAQRPTQAGAENCQSRSSISLGAGSNLPALASPALEENPCTPVATPMPVITNAENILPSPSPSVEVRQNSVNVVEVEDEEPLPQAPEAQPTNGPKATLEELVTMCGGVDQFERLLKDAGKSNYGPGQIALSAVASDLPVAGPSRSPLSRGQPPGSKVQPMSESAHDNLTPSVASKRPQETANEPRKRLQSFPSSSSGDAFTIPSATSVLPSQNGQDGAAASPSASNETMSPYLRTLAQRMQLVATMPRGGRHVEQSRLRLLRDACETSDYFYLVLHQLFCFEYGARKSNRQLPGLNEKHIQGLDVVAFLLVSNEEIPENAVTWFSIFPSPLDELLHRPPFASAHAKVLRSLESMAKFWANMRSQCTRRLYPPLVNELVTLFNVESFLFLQIIFRAILRDVWYGYLDQCFQATEAVFNKDYKDVMGCSSRRGIPARHDRHGVIKAYQRILESHRQHSGGGSTTSMAPPRQQSNIATVNDKNNRNTAQSEHNSSTRVPPMINTLGARHPSLSAAPGSAPIGIPTTQVGRQGSLSSQSQTSASDALNSPLASGFTQSPTTLPGFSNPGPFLNASMDSIEQWNGQLHQRQRRTSGTAANSLGAINHFQQTPYSTTPAQRTPSVSIPNVSETPNMHQLQQNLGLQQHSHNHRPSSNIANPRPSAQLEVRRSFSNRAGEATLPALGSHGSVQSSPSLPPTADSTPLIRSYPSLPNHPNPTISALHQAYLRSPTLSLDPNENPSSMGKLYRFIKHVLTPPEELDSNNRHVCWDFSVSKELINLFARDVPSVLGAPPTRAIVSGSRLCRIRCISLKNKAGMPSQNEWAVADNVWPGSTAIVLNGIALDIRKKTHHGKDLPIDVTSYIKEGQNNLSTAVIGFHEDSKSRFVIGVEFIQVVDEQKIKRDMKILPQLEARKRILDHSKVLDPDIEVIQSQRVLDLTDPFTARIFDVPVRGIHCQHNQCFDRDTFLKTRSGKVPREPCSPDEFRCPICGQDARPQSLIVDMFFAEVRTALKERDRLDVKAIILEDSGEWEIKEEEETTGESGDGTGRKGVGFVPGAVAARTASVSATRQSAPREVIELDDD
ncbi:hypothetical protein BDR22DRAFT_427199 [Usnea florida]